MTKFNIISITAIALAGVAASLMIQHQSQTKLRAGEALLEEQRSQVAALTEEHERLSNLVALAGSARADNNTAELARLRGEAAALKKQTSDLGPALANSPGTRPSRAASSHEPHTPEYYEQLHQMAGNKTLEARDLGMAFGSYADAHQNQSPSNLDQLASYLAKLSGSSSGSNQFEIVYQGSLDRLRSLPWGSVAVIREQLPWPGPDGRMMRLYGFPDGHSQIVSSDDGFQSFEAIHVIAPPNDATGQ